MLFLGSLVVLAKTGGEHSQVKKVCTIICVVGDRDTREVSDFSVRVRKVVFSHVKSVTVSSPHPPTHWHGVVPGTTEVQLGACSSCQPTKHFPGAEPPRFAWEDQSARWKRVMDGNVAFSCVE